MTTPSTLAVTICATKSYAYAMPAQARLVAANLADHDPSDNRGHIIIASDGSKELKDIADLYASIMPGGWQIHHVTDTELDEHANYKPAAQIVIARLRTNAFTAARKLRADRCWSLDSDVLPPANAYRCMDHMLRFDGGYYGISTCSYPNDSFLGGRGTETHPIAEDWLPEERTLPPWLAAVYERSKAFTSATKNAAERHRRIADRIKRCPPRGNVFALNAERWRQRGWLENAYPGIGKGAIVPSDWCGFGCTLLSREALAHAHFDGYAGQGTEDLWVVWKRWAQVGLRINCITHVVCDHVIREAKRGGTGHTHLRAYHELSGECVGHLRVEHLPWTG